MKLYAFVLSSGMVYMVGIFDDSTSPPAHAGGSWVDVTNVTPTPGPNWTYANGVFTAPADVQIVRTTTGKAIFEWFTTNEWNALAELIRTGTVAQAGAADRFRTQISGYWDTDISIDNEKIVYYFNGLASLGVITNERRDEFLGG